MSSIFHSKDTLRSQYQETLAAQITTTTASNPVSILSTRSDAVMFSIINNLDVEVWIMVVNPDDDAATKIPFIKLGSGQAFTLDAMATRMLNIPARTSLYYHVNGVTSSTGKVRTFVWGN